jgi:hypothetical protein
VDDLWAIGTWLAHEGRELLGRVREPGLWIALLAGLLLWSLAYQVSPSYTIAVGGDAQTHKRDYDAPFLGGDGFNDSEPGTLKQDSGDLDWWEQANPPYRWAKDSAAVLLPGLGGRSWNVSVTARSGRPDGSAVESDWQIGDDDPVRLTIEAHPRVYTIVGGAPGGDLRLTMQTPRIEGPGDPSKRNLGLVIHRIVVTPIATPGPQLPASGQLALLAAIQFICYSLGRRLALPRRWALPLALGVAALCAYMLIAQRLALTIWTPALATLALGCYLLAILLAPLLAAAARAVGLRATQGERGAALAATIGAFALRMAGLLHPYALFSDLGFNINNLEEVIRGDLFLYAGLPAEVGGGRAPYPPGQYLALAPLRLLIGTDRQAIGMLIQAGNALLESCTAALLWLLLRRAGMGRSAALIGAALYIVTPPLLRSFSVGEFANIFGQSLLAPLLLFLALGAPLARRWPAALVGGVLLLVILLSHTGVTISTVALLLAWLPLWWLAPSPPAPLSHAGERGSPRAISSTKGMGDGGWEMRQPWRLLVTGVSAGLIALALFYSGYSDLLTQRRALAAAAAPSPAPPAGPTFGTKVLGELRAGFSEAKGLSPLLALPGGLGLIWQWRRRPIRLDLVLLACWLGMLLSLATLLQADQAVRWQAFLFPALCLGAAPLFAAWARRGRAGAALALLALLYLTWLGLAMWARQVVEYLH